MATLPRDLFIDQIFEYAKKDQDVYFMSADLGAQALDQFRAELPKQFIHAGISEQNMIDVAAGLAQCGKKVFVYAMAPFVTYRCYEQIKVVFGAMGLPVTIIGIGAGYSYDDAGPTHYAIEDIACMRAIPGLEILNPSDDISALEAARVSYEEPKFRYIRLDRKSLPKVYDTPPLKGLSQIREGDSIALITNGYMFQKAVKVVDHFSAKGINIALIDMFKVKPVEPVELVSVLSKYAKIIVLEEHFLDGGMGSIIAENLADLNIQKPLLRIGIREKYLFDNGGREYIHQLSGIDVQSVLEKIERFI